MASITPYGKGWRAQVYVRGQRESQTFLRKREAEDWAAIRTIELKKSATQPGGQGKTLRDALEKYATEVASSHRGAVWEHRRIQQFLRMPALPLHVLLHDLTPLDFNRWRAWRQERVSDGSVRRELSLLAGVFKAARREWCWMTSSPLTEMVRPAKPKERERTFTRSEVKSLLRRLGYRTKQPPTNKSQLVAHELLLALQTGMRDSEMLGLRWDQVHELYVQLPLTKNGSARAVPLPRSARRLFANLRTAGHTKPFPVTSASRDALFRKARDGLGIVDIRFHDARHSAATTVGQSGRLTFPEFCKVFGWRDPKHALIYVNPTISELAAKLG